MKGVSFHRNYNWPRAVIALRDPQQVEGSWLWYTWVSDLQQFGWVERELQDMAHILCEQPKENPSARVTKGYRFNIWHEVYGGSQLYRVLFPDGDEGLVPDYRQCLAQYGWETTAQTASDYRSWIRVRVMCPVDTLQPPPAESSIP